MQTPDPALPANSLGVILALSLAFILAAVAAVIVGSAVRRMLLAVEGHSHGLPIPSLVPTTVRMVRVVTFFLTGAVLAFPALDIAGVHLEVGLHQRDIVEWMADSGARLGLLLVLAFGVNRMMSALITRAERDIASGIDAGSIERQKRATTLARTFRRFVSVVIWAVSILVVLRELDVDITPILTGAGILGLAVGFGAQTLVKDIISGVFLIVDDQVRVGDVVGINGVGGLVEEINLRTLVMRDLEGQVHVIPNGDVRMISNRTKNFAYYVVDLAVEYGEDTDRVVEAVKATGADLQADPQFAPNILEPIEILGVDAFGDSAVTLKFRIKTPPLKQWEVGRELRRRLKKTLDARGITIPFNQLDVTVKNAGQTS